MLKKIGIAVGVLVGVVVLLLAVLFVWGRVDPQHAVRTLGSEDAAAPLVSAAAPAFTLPRIGEPGEVALADYRGKIVILDFWATWCGPCERTSPHIETVRSQRDDVVVIAINVREDENTTAADLDEHVRKYFEEKGYGFISVKGDQATLDAYKTHAIPHVFVIDGEGIVRYSGVGVHNEKNMREAVAAAGG